MSVRLICILRAYIEHQDLDDDDVPAKDYWIGMIHEIRAPADDPNDVSTLLACVYS